MPADYASYDKCVNVEEGGLDFHGGWNIRTNYIYKCEDEEGAPCKHAEDLGIDEDYKGPETLRIWRIPFAVFDGGPNVHGICAQCVMEQAEKLGAQ